MNLTKVRNLAIAGAVAAALGSAANATNVTPDFIIYTGGGSAEPVRVGPVETELARVRLFQHFACSHLRRARPGRAPRLAKLWRDRRYACGWSLLVYSDLHSTVRAAEPNTETLVSE